MRRKPEPSVVVRWALVLAATALAFTPIWAAPVVVDLLTDADAVRIDGDDVGDRIGAWATSCDVNGDGIGDVALSADRADGTGNLRTSAGEVYVLYGRRGAWPGPLSIAATADVRIIGEGGFDNLGQGMACGDVDGDGFDDLVLCAYNADGPSNTRTAAGQAHLILGEPLLPAVIDLAADPTPVIYGATAGDLMCDVGVAVGDVNGDGLMDVITGARGSTSRAGTQSAAGRADVQFGRAAWPAVIDLLTDSDLTIWGSTGSDALGYEVRSGDLDGDGTDELLLAAPAGDGPLDQRDRAGDIFVFRGRTVWPSMMDLAFDLPDMWAFGADLNDRAGWPGGLAVTDVDGDGWSELAVGIWRGAGPDNSESLTGEARTHEPGSALPSVVDLATDTDSVVYGADSGDWSCMDLRAGDHNGDGIDDLICGSPQADGPGETRFDSGEVTVFFGRNPFPARLDIGLGEEDILIYAPLESDGMGTRGSSDVNGDGILEAVFHTSADHGTRIPSAWLVSPVDVDGDGITQLPDNCPLVFNPTQADADLDQVGDACQGDWDGDGQGDTMDCAPAAASGGTPAEVANLMLSGAPATTASWQATAFADEYDVSRGSIASLDGADYGACQNGRDPDLTDTSFVDDESPEAGAGYFYLVRGRNLTCSVAGTYGATSGGQERVDTNPAACP